MMKKYLTAALLALTLITGAVRPSYAFLDKTRFVLHAGAAFFAFHHWVWAPYKAGAFSTGAPHRTKALLKGGVALLFAVHEVKVANEVAHKSNSPTLQKLAGALDNMGATFASVGQRLKSGQFSPGDIEKANSAVGEVDSDAAAQGTKIKDAPIPIPGL